MQSSKEGLKRWKRSRWSQHLDLAVGVVGTLVAYFPLANQGLAEIFGVVTLLLAANKISIQVHIEDRLEPVTKMAEVLDLTQALTVSDIHDLSKVYISITEEEFRRVKENVLSEAIQKLKKLAQQKKSDALSTAEYYAWLLPILSQVRKGEEVHAISVMHDAEWDDSPAETRFFEENLAAAARGALIERIFVMPRSKITEAMKLAPVGSHLRGATPGLRGHFVDLDYLKRQDSRLLADIGHGFIEIGGRVALVDQFGATGEVRGEVSMDKTEIRELTRIFEKLQLYSRELTADLSQQVSPVLIAGPPMLAALPSAEVSTAR